jgi:hypothetical protein
LLVRGFPWTSFTTMPSGPMVMHRSGLLALRVMPSKSKDVLKSWLLNDRASRHLTRGRRGLIAVQLSLIGESVIDVHPRFSRRGVIGGVDVLYAFCLRMTRSAKSSSFAGRGPRFFCFRRTRLASSSKVALCKASMLGGSDGVCALGGNDGVYAAEEPDPMRYLGVRVRGDQTRLPTVFCGRKILFLFVGSPRFQPEVYSDLAIVCRRLQSNITKLRLQRQ